MKFSIMQDITWLSHLWRNEFSEYIQKYIPYKFHMKKLIQCLSVGIYRNERLINLWNNDRMVTFGRTSGGYLLQALQQNDLQEASQNHVQRTFEYILAWRFYHLTCACSLFSCLQVMLEKTWPCLVSTAPSNIYVQNEILPLAFSRLNCVGFV